MMINGCFSIICFPVTHLFLPLLLIFFLFQYHTTLADFDLFIDYTFNQLKKNPSVSKVIIQHLQTLHITKALISDIQMEFKLPFYLASWKYYR